MQTAVGCHFDVDVRDHVDITFPNRWMGRGGPVHWPPRSPDLTPLDFFLCGNIKSLVYETPMETREELVARILVACLVVQQTPWIFESVRQIFLRRCTTCI
jgi:hypothetical protein